MTDAKRRATVHSIAARVVYPEPARILKDTLGEQKLRAAFRRINISWPTFTKIGLALAENLTELVPGHIDGRQGTLLAACLRQGIHAGDERLRELGTSEDHSVFALAVSRLLEPVHQVAMWRIADANGEEWDVFQDGPLHGWRLGRSDVNVSPYPDQERADDPFIARSVRHAMAFRILSRQDLEVLGGRLDDFFG